MTAVDAVIVLANLMDERGNLNEETRARVTTAVKLMTELKAPKLVTCGWAYRPDTEICIAHAMADFAIEEGLDCDRILTETTSRDTVGDAVFSKKIVVAPRGWSRLAIVTSSYHVPRTEKIFSFVYGPRFDIQVIAAPGPNSGALAESETNSLEAFRSTFEGIEPGDDEAIYSRLAGRHPFYNGTVHPPI